MVDQPEASAADENEAQAPPSASRAASHLLDAHWGLPRLAEQNGMGAIAGVDELYTPAGDGMTRSCRH